MSDIYSHTVAIHLCALPMVNTLGAKPVLPWAFGFLYLNLGICLTHIQSYCSHSLRDESLGETRFAVLLDTSPKKNSFTILLGTGSWENP